MFRDAIGASLMGAGTSFYAGFVIFSVIGFIAFKTGLSIDDVVASGNLHFYTLSMKVEWDIGMLRSVHRFLLTFNLHYSLNHSMDFQK